MSNVRWTNPDEQFRVVLVPSEERPPQKRETVRNKFSPNDPTKYTDQHRPTKRRSRANNQEMGGLVDQFRNMTTVPQTQDVATRTSEPAQSPQVNLVPPNAHPEHLFQTPLGRRQFTADVRRMWTSPQGGHPRCNDSICHDAMCPGTPNSYLGDRMQAAPGPDPGAPGTGYPCPVHRNHSSTRRSLRSFYG